MPRTYVPVDRLTPTLLANDEVPPKRATPPVAKINAFKIGALSGNSKSEEKQDNEETSRLVG